MGLVDATPDNVGRALGFVERFEALGGTNISEALDTAAPVTLRAAHRLAASYEWDHHVSRGRAAGMADRDIAALADPDMASWEIVKCPEVDWDLTYRFRNTKGSILRCKDIDRDKTFELFHERLRQSGNRETCQ